MRDEELAAAGVLPVERHADRTAKVWQLVQFIANRVPRPTVTIAARVAVLDDEVGDHAMDGNAVEEASVSEVDEVGDGDRRVRDRQLDLDRAAVRLDKRMRRELRRDQRVPCRVI